MKLYSLIILSALISCSSNIDDTNDVLNKKWISIEKPVAELWFQNWSSYERLFLKIVSDTVIVKPSMYVTRKKNKPYLYPKDMKRIEYQQLIGNIYWDEEIIWDNNYENKFTWLVDRSNPKINLPVTYNGSATLIDNRLVIDIKNDNENILNYTFRPSKIY